MTYLLFIVPPHLLHHLLPWQHLVSHLLLHEALSVWLSTNENSALASCAVTKLASWILVQARYTLLLMSLLLTWTHRYPHFMWIPPQAQSKDIVAHLS